MVSMSGNHLLKIPSDTVENLRKIYDLDKPGRLEDSLKIMNDWILKQDHIIKKDFMAETWFASHGLQTPDLIFVKGRVDPRDITSKLYLEKTLVQCKGSVEKAKKQIDRLCTMKTLVPKFFSKTNVKVELKNVSDLVWLVPLPTLTEEYYRILMVKSNIKKLTPETPMEYFQYNLILTEYLKAHDYFNGLIIIHDCRQVNLMDVITTMNTAELQQFISIIINGYGARLKGIYLLTESSTIEILIKIVKQFVSEKIGNRIYVQKTVEELQKVIPKELLPNEYGGNEKSVEELYDDWIEELSSEEHVEYMRMMNKACTDETKRLEGTFNEEYMGMPGSFRCLSVD